MYTKDLEERIIFLFAIVKDLEKDIRLEEAFFNLKRRVDEKSTGQSSLPEEVQQELMTLYNIAPLDKEVHIYRGNLDYSEIEQGFKDKLPFYAILSKQGFDSYIVNLIRIGEEQNLLTKTMRYAIDSLTYQRMEYLLDEAKMYDILGELTFRGVPILDALKQVSNCSTNISMKNAFSQIIRNVKEGDRISEAAAHNKDIFDKYTIKCFEEYEGTIGASDLPEPEELTSQELRDAVRGSAKVLRRLAQYKRSLIMIPESEI